MANGLPSLTLVGLADVEVKEARERVRSAILNSGLDFAHNQRITVNLAPPDLPKDSGCFDLPIALGILAASGQIDDSKLSGLVFAGELSLSDELRPVRGALAMSLALQQHAHPPRTKSHPHWIRSHCQNPKSRLPQRHPGLAAITAKAAAHTTAVKLLGKLRASTL